MNNLRGVLKGLKSDKIKERQEALNSIRTTFSDDKVVQNFHVTEDSESDTRGWLVVFQALFQAVRSEKLALVKATSKTAKSSGSSSAAVQRRLEDAAKVVRWLTERATRNINAKVLFALFDHLTQMMVSQGQVLKPVALDYIKALKYLASYSPHLDHMDDETWIRCTEICFNIILGDSIQTSFRDDEDLVPDSDEDEVAADSQNSDEDDLPATSNIHSKKRSRAGGSHPHPSQKPKSPLKAKTRRHHRQISVSLEQVECASFLVALLRSSSSPLLSQNYPYLPSAILTRLHRFLEMYPGESSLLPDYLRAISHTLGDLSLNKVRDVRKFARSSWNGLVALWGMKDRRLKEYLVIVLRALFPFISSDDSVYMQGDLSHDSFDIAEGLTRLWNLLDGEADNRWGVNGLNLEALRLELLHTSKSNLTEMGDTPFVANTFRSGWNFDSEQALSWAILELQADCARKLFQLSECMHASTPSRTDKRLKLENPLTSLLQSIQTKGASHIRSYHLQILLFFVDRHWSIIHDSLKQNVINTLLQFVTFDDGDMQSWVFLNFAAIAFAQRFSVTEEDSLQPISPTAVPFMDAANWDPIWTHAVRRANVPHICRSACHAAHTLIASLHHISTPGGQSCLTSQRVLLEIETLAKDMDVQGPSYPFDSVCMFLSQCLRIAAQDVRLYRMQLEEKVLNWLMDTWTVTSMDRGKMSLHTVKDMMLLLESICGLNKRSDLVSRSPLPASPLTDSMIVEQKVKIIKDFLLHATLPSFYPSERIKVKGTATTTQGLSTTPGAADILLPPRGRERRISSFLQKMLDSLSAEWGSANDSRLYPTAEVARQSLDLAITAIAFEAVLILNGTSSSKRVMQTSGKFLVSVLSYIRTSRWTTVEKGVVALGLEPLVYVDINQLKSGWDAIVPPNAAEDGIAGFKPTTWDFLDHQFASKNNKVAFLRTIWKNIDLQDALQELSSHILANLTDSMGRQGSKLENGEAMEVDDKDGFGPIRTMASHLSPSNDSVEANGPPVLLLRMYITFLTRGPMLQASSGQATRDKDLVNLVMQSIEHDPRRFTLISSVLLEEIQLGTLEFNTNQFNTMLTAVGDRLLPSYTSARDERTQLLVIQLLQSTLHLWAMPTISLGETEALVSTLCHWLSKALSKQKIKSWVIRDAFALFLDRYLSIDPAQDSWSNDARDEERGPTNLIQKLATDDDIRVRFRVGLDISRLFSAGHLAGVDLLNLYDNIKHSFSEDVDNYEQILTRLLSLGNIMITSSAVRRGPYWHLLETCVHSSAYSLHIETVLIAVSERLGMPSLSTLFEAYASQLAYSIFQKKEADFFGFPPRLLGYRDRRSCAEASFHAFVPTYILMGADDLFQNHCMVLQKKPIDGLRECFGDIAGIYITNWFHEHEDDERKEMENALRGFLRDEGSFESDMRQHFDSVVASILRTLSDQDISADGPITSALKSIPEQGKCIQTFAFLVCHRNLADFDAHHPNLPAFGSVSVLRSLSWLAFRLPGAFTEATTYHVMHALLAGIHRTPLTNEQIRLVNALSLWIALRHEDFEDVTLLYALVHGATCFLLQPSLARAAQSILEWTFRCYRKLKVHDTRLSSVLIRICCISYDYTLVDSNSSLARLGRDLLSWIDDQAILMGKTPMLKNTILRALPAWPSQPSETLSELYNGLASDNIAAMLTDQRISSNKFRVVRRLRDQAISGHYDADEFSKSDFWRLKECIPANDRLQEEDIAAFAELLTINHGHIDNLSTEPPVTNPLRSRHRRNSKKRGSQADDSAVSARDAIIYGLLNLLEDESQGLVYISYNTLRLIMSVLSEDISQLPTWPAEYRIELEFLRTYPRKPISRPRRDLTELLSSEQYIQSTSNFSDWIVRLSVLLSDILSSKDQVFGQLHSVLMADVTFGEQILPVLVLALLEAERQDRATCAQYKEILSKYFTQVLSSQTTSIPCLKAIVDVVLHLRYFNSRTRDYLAYNKWLEIDFHLLAQNAIRCGAYTTALLFLELSTDHKHDAGSVMQAHPTEQILYEIYAHIDEPDGFYGIQTKDLHSFLLKRLHHEKQWDKAFRFHGAALEAGSSQPDEAEGLLNSFHSFGFDQLAIATLQNSWGTSNLTHTSSTLSYRLGWRTETWDLPDCDGYIPGAPLYNALRAIYRERDSRSIDTQIHSALRKEMGRLRSLGTENVAEIREVAQELMCLNQILQWKAPSTIQRLQSKTIDLDQWSNFTDIDKDFEFSAIENIMAVRMALVRSVRQREERQQIGTIITPFVQGLLDLEKRTLLQLSEAARESNQIQIALNSVIRAQRLNKVTSFDVSQEYANVLWLLREEKLGVRFLTSLIQQHKSESTPIHVKALLLARLGTWTSEACLEKPTEIWKLFFDPAVTLLENLTASGEPAKISRVYRECAIFADRQYHATLQSSDAIRWKVYVDRKKQEIQVRQVELSKSQSGSNRHKELKSDQDRAKKLLQADSELFRKHNIARDEFLRQAMDMYSRCLHASDTFDDDASIRFCSLWFANFGDEGVVGETARKALNRIPSRKLVFLSHQLAARLAKASTGQQLKNQDNLQRLVLRMCQEHPFHSLYQVYCLQADKTPSSRRQSGRQSQSQPSTQTERIAAAEEIFGRLRNDDISGIRVRQVESLCDACLQWATHPIVNDDRYKQKPILGFKIPGDLLICRISNLQVPVPTVDTKIDPTMQYSHCIWLERYDTTFRTAGGVNLPKITVCYGSDGLKYKQLFKGEGNDDLRQDAVMEQVFDLVNKVLLRDRETSRRALKVRGYKVIPLGAQAGLLEFVGNTSPLRDWLLTKHLAYRPKDIKPGDASNRLQKVQKDHPHNGEKQLKVFLEIRTEFKPVLRHYFTENHKNPMAWFGMRLRYTRSVATTSIVGHVLGLGDRHISNILMDNLTGEVVHIDLGIAFDQGKLLPIPERVPFRLTADIIDGMGTSGTQGVFQRCAEETLRVLREDSEVIMTVLEVFKHDPLHSWTASELKVRDAQQDVPSATTLNDTNRFNLGIGIDMSSGTAEEAADRALSSVARKLDKSLSVESTVNELIAEATDPLNLATIFYGWSPHV